MKRMDLMSCDNKCNPFFLDPSQIDQTHDKCPIKMKTFNGHAFLYQYYVNVAAK